MKAVGKISMFVSVMLVLMLGTVLQYHHHGESHVCLCLNPIEHCEGHHHHEHQDGNAHAADDCSHEDAGGCTLHLDSGEAVVECQADAPQQDLSAAFFGQAESNLIISGNNLFKGKSYEKTKAGIRLKWFLRGPPMC